MSKQKVNQKGYIKTQTVLVLVCLAFVIGLISGVFLTIFKSESLSTSSSTVNHGLDVKEMVQSLKAEAARNPQNAMVWGKLGNTYFDSGQYEKAISAYEKSIKIDPNNPNILTDLGIMYRRIGKPEKAISSFDKAITADPKHEMSRLNKGIVLMHDLKNRDDALKVWEELLEINPLAMASKEQSVDELIRHYKEHEKN